MRLSQMAQIDVLRYEHEERIREADRMRRVNEARKLVSHDAAAPHERRFSFPRFVARQSRTA